MKSMSDFNPVSILKAMEAENDVYSNIVKEDLLSEGLLRRLHTCYPSYSGILPEGKPMFHGQGHYSGINGFRKIVEILKSNGIDIGFIEERELFIEVYRFMATHHVLNAINWKNFRKDSIFQLVFPQPEMIDPDTSKKYFAASGPEEKKRVLDEHRIKTNPHDGKQKINQPWFVNEEGELEIVTGSQHKYPPCQLIFDKSTQSCFAFCTYCFRHAQVRNDEDMFLQDDIDQIHRYLMQHKEVTDVLITGGDGGYLTYERLEKYALPFINDERLFHIKTLRIGSRLLTFQPELILSDKFNKHLELFSKLRKNGVQPLWMSHFSTPREVLNPFTIAAINRLRHYEVTVKTQSPIMKHISLFTDENGKVDVDGSAKNWIDLANIIAVLGVGFHSMYCARPTGEHHYFTTPLADINRVFSKVYKTLASVNRPTRYITMTSSAGKISLMGTTEIDGEKLFVLKFNEGRNMDWVDTVYLAKYDETENTIANLKPYRGEKHFYENELKEIEKELEHKLTEALKVRKVK